MRIIINFHFTAVTLAFALFKQAHYFRHLAPAAHCVIY
jgi:hypothetical protein